MPVVQDEISLVKVANGDDGRGILGTPVATYAQSTSGTIPPTTWSATRPNVPAGQYLWTRVVTTYTDNTTSETQTPTLMGAEGESGLGIKDKSISYAVGTSGNTPPTSGWQETIPTVSANQYLWTKTTLVYTDESKTEAYSVGKMGANGADAKLLYLTASAENMAFNADDTPKTTQTINISAKLQNVTGTATFTAIPYIGNTAQTAITLGGTGNTRTLTSAQWTNKNWTLIAITATLDSLNDTLSIVKVKDGKEGDTHYPHTAWLMADGRFTTTYPEENLISDATNAFYSKIAFVQATGTKSITDKVAKINLSAATGSYLFYLSNFKTFYNFEKNAHYALSFDMKGTKEFSVTSVGINQATVTKSNWNGTVGTDWQRMKITFRPDYSSADATNLNFHFFVGTGNADVLSNDIFMKNVKLEKVDASTSEATIYTTSPSEDYENAYPKYEGFYSDTNQAGSDNPDDYKPWTPFMGPQGPAGEDGKDGSDGKDGANGQDAKEVISGYLSNDSIIVPANASGTVTDFTKALGDFIIYEGQTKVSSGVTYSKVSETGMTSTINSAGRYTVTALSADVGTVTYQAVYKAVTIQKIMIVVKNKQGATGPAGSNGTDGKGIVSSATTYQAGTSGTTPPTGTWSTSIPSVSENQYLWTKIVLTYSDNTNSAAYSVGKMGAKGEAGATGSTGATGATGNGIKSTTINFASSTSGTTAPSSGWSTSIPTVAAGSFLWTRTVLTFTDNTTNTSYTVAKQGEKGDPTGIISQSTVPTNPYVGMLWQNTGASGYIIGATYQWNGSKFNLYIFTADNIVATTLSAITANLGNVTAGTLTGVTFVSPFDFWGGESVPNGTAQMWRRGQKTTKNGEDVTMWEDYNKSTGEKIKEGGVTQDSNGFYVFVNDPANYSQRASYTTSGIRLADSRGLGDLTSSFLTYNDLVTVNETLLTAASGFSQYSTTGGNAPIASRTGRQVMITGAFKPNGAVTIMTDFVRVSTQLPIWARPRRTYQIRTQGTGMNTLLVRVTVDGYIEISRYGKTDYVNLSGGEWLTIHMGYAGADIF
ncbi:collagen-like protein [Enterococcus casseliflavus]|uniref:collagen-like protein n=1 Tax=Enterococcus casseliflavus TaxID=37734 RepID=UPI00191809D0|nr:collagen-like protein [Enterococcus casseliflavus]QQU16628.1 collagen-like protein [Enterococcus casseliflavus]